MKKIGAVWFRHDCDARLDRKLITLKRDHGWAGLGLWWAIVEFLSTCPDYRYPKDILLEALASGDTTVLQTYNAMFTTVLLKVDDDGNAYSESLIDRMRERELVCKKNLANIEKRWAAKKNQVLRCDTTVIPNYTTVIQEQSRTEQRNNNIQILPPNDLQEREEQESKEQNKDPLTPFMGAAQKVLDIPDPEKPKSWESSNAWVLAGRRPLKKYPDIFLSAPELAEVYRQYSEAGLEPKDAREAFQSVQGRLMNMKAEGKSTERAAVFNWLIGWAKQEILENRIKETRFAKVKQPYGAMR